MMKKFISMLLSMVVVFSTCSAFAQDNEIPNVATATVPILTVPENATSEEKQSIITATLNELSANETSNIATATIPILTVSESATSEEKQAIITAALNELSANKTSDTDTNEVSLSSNEQVMSVSRAFAMILRIGDTSKCELYIGWTGDIVFSMWAFDLFQVKSTSNPTMYANIGGSTINCTTASADGAVRVSNIDIPKDVSTVHVDVVDLKAYAVVQQKWVSGWTFGSKVNVQ